MSRLPVFSSLDTMKHMFACFCAALACIILAGCGGGGTTAPTADETGLRNAMQVLGMQYGGYLSAHGGKAPKDEAAFRDFIQSRLPELAMYNVKSADDLLLKGRDGQPLAIVTGETIAAPEAPEYPWAAYEASATDGTRMATNTRGGVFTLKEAEFAAQVPVK